jgi:hypothetical protein
MCESVSEEANTALPRKARDGRSGRSRGTSSAQCPNPQPRHPWRTALASVQSARRMLLRQWAQLVAVGQVSLGAPAAVFEWSPPCVAPAPSTVTAGRLNEHRFLWRPGTSRRMRFASDGSRRFASGPGGYVPVGRPLRASRQLLPALPYLPPSLAVACALAMFRMNKCRAGHGWPRAAGTATSL